MKVKEFYEKNKCIIIIWGLFILSVIIRTIISAFNKHIFVLYDELIYYSYAENLGKGRGFPLLYQFKYDMRSRFLYSILISPAFLTYNRTIQFRLISIINSVVLSTGIFPTYLLAKNLLNNEKMIIFCGFLYVLMPDMVYSISFMADIPMLPLGLSLLYLSFKLLNYEELSNYERILYSLLFCLFQFLIVWVKRAGIAFALIFASCFIFCFCVRIIKERKLDLKKCMLVVLFLAVILLALSFFTNIAHLKGEALYQIENVIETIIDNPKEYIRYYCYYYYQVLLAILFMPMIIPFVYFSSFDDKGKKLICLMAVSTFSFTLVFNRVSYSFGDIGRVSLRYIMFLWIPFLILYCKSLEIELKERIIERVAWGITIVLIGLMSVFYHGPQKESDIEYTLLNWAEGWEKHNIVYCAISICLVLLFLVLIRKKKSKLCGLLFFSFWIIIQIYNNIDASYCYYNDYKMEDSDIEEIESFVRLHPSNNFLVLNTGKGADNYDLAGDFNYDSTKVSDTYLNYPNVVRSSLQDIILNEQQASIDGRYDLDRYRLTLDFGYLSKVYPDLDVDYVVLPKDACAEIDMDQCVKLNVGNNDWFSIYKIDNSRKIPNIKSIRYIGEGKTFYSVDNSGFFSKYEKNGNTVFVSDNTKQDCVMYGPYTTLSPGKYSFTIHYEYECDSNEESKEIGIADLAGEGVNSEDCKTSVFSDQNTAILYYEVDKPVKSFEIRLFANEGGLRVVGVEIERNKINE